MCTYVCENIFPLILCRDQRRTLGPLVSLYFILFFFEIRPLPAQTTGSLFELGRLASQQAIRICLSVQAPMPNLFVSWDFSPGP